MTKRKHDKILVVVSLADGIMGLYFYFYIAFLSAL